MKKGFGIGVHHTTPPPICLIWHTATILSMRIFAISSLRIISTRTFAIQVQKTSLGSVFLRDWSSLLGTPKK